MSQRTHRGRTPEQQQQLDSLMDRLFKDIPPPPRAAVIRLAQTAAAIRRRIAAAAQRP